MTELLPPYPARAMPPTRPGLRVGLLGGSFDPAHEGHRHITLEALRRFGLDRVWWLVSPRNPLKAEGPAPLDRRIARGRRAIAHPRVSVTGLEARLGTRHTAATLAALRRRAPGVRFVWLMGADNLADFHRWERWADILSTVPVGVLARPGQRLEAQRSPAAFRFRAARLPATASTALPFADAPAWCFVNIPLDATSSTAIRARGGWG